MLYCGRQNLFYCQHIRVLFNVGTGIRTLRSDGPHQTKLSPSNCHLATAQHLTAVQPNVFRLQDMKRCLNVKPIDFHKT